MSRGEARAARLPQRQGACTRQVPAPVGPRISRALPPHDVFERVVQARSSYAREEQGAQHHRTAARVRGPCHADYEPEQTEVGQGRECCRCHVGGSLAAQPTDQGVEALVEAGEHADKARSAKRVGGRRFEGAQPAAAQAVANLAKTTAILSSQSNRFEDLLQALDDLSVQGNSILTSYLPDVTTQFHALASVTSAIASEQHDLGLVLHWMPGMNYAVSTAQAHHFVQLVDNIIVCGIPGGGSAPTPARRCLNGSSGGG